MDRTITKCERCPVKGMYFSDVTKPYSCRCNPQTEDSITYLSAGDICIEESITELITDNAQLSVSAANQITYNDIETYNEQSEEWVLTSIQHTSGTFTHYYLKAAVECQEYQSP